jgi:hypothetical protein
MTTVAVDYRAPMHALRQAVRDLKDRPGPGTLSALTRVLLALPTEPFNNFTEETYWGVLRTVEVTEDNPLFARIDRMERAVTDLAAIRLFSAGFSGPTVARSRGPTLDLSG